MDSRGCDAPCMQTDPRRLPAHDGAQAPGSRCQASATGPSGTPSPRHTMADPPGTSRRDHACCNDIPCALDELQGHQWTGKGAKGRRVGRLASQTLIAHAGIPSLTLPSGVCLSRPPVGVPPGIAFCGREAAARSAKAMEDGGGVRRRTTSGERGRTPPATGRSFPL